MLELLTYILDNILEKGDYAISEREEAAGKMFSVAVKKEKVGLIIGKGGRTIKAIQDILYAASKLKGERAFVEVTEL